MNTDFLTLDKRHPLGENATGVIAHFSDPLSVKRVFQTTCCLPAKPSMSHSRLAPEHESYKKSRI